jgi:hypothetical protein
MVSLQLILRPCCLLLLLFAARRLQIRHPHDLDDEAGPAREVLRALALACLGIVLFPGEAGFFPAVVDGVYDVFAQLGVEFCGAGFVLARGLGDVLMLCC